MKKTDRRIRLALCLGTFFPLLSGTTAFGTELPNIIFIFADDWGYGDMSKHGSTFCETPNLDRMAAEGIDFANFTVNNPVCSPSRVAVMTGQFPARQSRCLERLFAHHTTQTLFVKVTKKEITRWVLIHKLQLQPELDSPDV